MNSNEIRSRFLEYFRERGHEVVPSSPLVPANDPTLLFTNAGMVQFKDVFLGADRRPYNRATTSQRCVRAGGKHNDLDNVGYTARHHTFFEMLGNFSFGDYFKREAIAYCWDLLTREFGLPAERLWVTVYQDDDEAADVWLNEIQVDPTRFTRIGDKPGGKRFESDNFWAMGDTGPCGPCSEVFYDHGPEVAGGPPGSPDEDGDRYIEIWNLVFMQYNRAANGEMTPLPKPSVDTGMGLERLAAVLQGVHSNYDIDLFRALIAAAAEVTGARDRDDKSLRVIADHIRSCAFLVVDGVVPSNEGRGYVLRRILRRAVRHGHKLGTREPFFYALVESLDQQMGDAYPELRQRRGAVEKVLRQEEERFAETLEQGMAMLRQSIETMSGTEIPGETLFRLYDTYGFPVDLTADIARERGLTVDLAGFETAMAAQRERARAASQFVMSEKRAADIGIDSEFTGYERLSDEGTIVALLVDGERVDTLKTEEPGTVVLDRTPFYAESGGQVGDRGVLSRGQSRFEVRDTQKQGKTILHIGVVTEGALHVGDKLRAEVDAPARRATARNHSATHLLHAALREVLGSHVQQKGSLVAPDRLRFDFSHYEPVTDEQLARIERLVNEWIIGNQAAETRVMPVKEAMESAALALFGEKYEDMVRVLRIGDVSTELCGGTHVSRSGDIGPFKLVSETGVAAGVRRIEAITGERALEWIHEADTRMARLASVLKSERDGIEDRLEQVLTRSRELEKEVERLKSRIASARGDDLTSQAVEVDGIKVLAARLDDADPKSLRSTVDQLKQKLGSAAVVIATVSGDDRKVSLVAGVSPDCTDRLQAGPLANFVASQIGGRGGGRADMAQAGGSDATRLDQALAGVVGWVRDQVVH